MSHRLSSSARAALAASLLGLTALAAPSIAHGADTSNEPAAYRIGVGDKLAVYIYQEPDQECLVRPDGAISLRLAGEMKAAGRTPAELAATIEKRLAEKGVLGEADVTVAVLEIHSYRIYVLGQVNNQSAIESVQPLRLLQALATAGGLAEFAKGKIAVLREVGGVMRRIEIDYDDLVDGRGDAENILLASGDVVVVLR